MIRTSARASITCEIPKATCGPSAPTSRRAVWTFFIPRRGFVIQPRVAAQPLPWVSHHHEFPSLKGMNTPTGELSIPFRDGLNKNGLIPRVVRCRTTLGCIIDPLRGKHASLPNLKDWGRSFYFECATRTSPEEIKSRSDRKFPPPIPDGLTTQ